MENSTFQALLASSSNYQSINNEIMLTRDEALIAMGKLQKENDLIIEKLAKALIKIRLESCKNDKDACKFIYQLADNILKKTKY